MIAKKTGRLNRYKMIYSVFNNFKRTVSDKAKKNAE